MWQNQVTMGLWHVQEGSNTLRLLGLSCRGSVMSFEELGIKPCQPNTCVRLTDADKGLPLTSGIGQQKWHLYYKQFAAEFGSFSEGFQLDPPAIVGTNWFARKNFLIRRPRVFRVIVGASFPRVNGRFNFIPPTNFGPGHPFICPGDTFLHTWLPSAPTPGNYGYLFKHAILSIMDSVLSAYRVTPILMSTPTDPFGVQIFTPVEVVTPKALVGEYVGGEIYNLYLSMSQSQLQFKENYSHFTEDQHKFSNGRSNIDYEHCPQVVIDAHNALPCKDEYGIYTIPFGPLDNVRDGANPASRRADNADTLRDHMIESFNFKLEVAVMNFSAVEWTTSKYNGPFYFPTIKLCGFNNPGDLVNEFRNWGRFTSQEAAMDMNEGAEGVRASLPSTEGGGLGVEGTWDISVTTGFTGETDVEAIAGALIDKAVDYFGYTSWP
jgi:hypothetical protein